MSTLKSSAEDLTLNADGSGNDVIIQSNASTKAIVTAEGTVGIGTDSPSRLLTLYGDTGIALQNSTTGTGTGNGTHIWVNSEGSGELLIQNREDSDIEFYADDTVRMRIDSTGAVTMPAQPAFLVYQTVSQEISNAAQTTITFTTEVTDRNADYDGTSTFTAPVTGLYLFTAQVVTDAGASSDTRFGDANLYFVASNRTLRIRTGENESSADDYISMSGSVLIDMDASDTITVDAFFSRVGASGSTDTIASSSQTNFSGHLVC